MAATLRSYLELVRFSHTIFALPFALMAVILAFQAPAPAATSPAVRWRRGSRSGVRRCLPIPPMVCRHSFWGWP